ncbi:isoprenylcysteine carboxylmethyltransferase family protein [Caulobacter sp. UNC358MFTsu5.1]|uniref:methyltransferase family protein n=1 Tax=Caulobacter sp. UNC358MFTsu5.1 TaxID=1449049 RepID=UPI0004A6E869|nr:isoprenylcysteine carboxylmethyltransferase family protein [Caulobacter sp. UNC358MFTsu5.1]
MEKSTDRTGALLGSALFLVVAPGVVAGLVPWWLSGWRFAPPLLGLEAGRWLGGALILVAAPVLLEAFVRFALEGRGTPAPVAPTKMLVVGGAYRFVRNPMYVAVVSLILGQALLLGQAVLLAYGAAAWLTMHLFVVFYEEPRLLGDYGQDYETFRRHVPRWLPRLRPWRPAA